MAATDEFVDRSTTAAVEEKAKLQKHFGRFDIFFFLICTIVGLDTLGAVSGYGAQAFVWLVFLAVFFFLPYALLEQVVSLARGVLDERYEVTGRPHRELCATCPGRRALCSYSEERTLAPAPLR